jgi:putative YhdH/YhfP family quinone oxidoreductase
MTISRGDVDTFRCYLVRKTGNDRVEAGVDARPLRELPAGDVLIRVRFSSLNYKDALAATGHPGVARKFPHVPGIDSAGEVVESGSPRFRPGDAVIMTGHELGAERWGGWAEYVRVPADWVVPLPAGLTLEESMILGTAGFTAAQCVYALRHHDVRPESGEVLVTGATGGVGSIAVMILAKLGYQVTAVTGKPAMRASLERRGARRIISRDEAVDGTNRPLLSATYAGGVDTVGGATLGTLLRSMKHRGCVAACGLVGGSDLPVTVYPFILRGVTLAGIDSAWCPEDRRREIWRLLSQEWKPQHLNELAAYVTLDGVGDAVQRILRGEVAGRVVVRI